MEKKDERLLDCMSDHMCEKVHFIGLSAVFAHIHVNAVNQITH
jgi:hypothetical protein